jgi:thioredoxin-related protein
MSRFLLLATLALAAAASAAEGWITDFAAAKKQAAEQGKDLLVDFTGSDWCGWCIKLKDEVFKQPGFAAASQDFVLVEIDFPQSTELPAELKAQNDALGQTYEIQGYPTILLMDAQGRAYAKTGYQPGGPAAYLEHLAALRAQKEQRDAAFAKAAQASGAEQAQLYHAALAALGEAPLAGYDAEIAAIIAGDADGALGLKLRYELRPKLEQVMAALQSGDLAGARTQVDALLATPGLEGELKQEVLFRSALIQYNTDRDDKAKVAAILKEALAAAPDGAQAAQIQGILQQFEAAPAPQAP